MSTNYRDTFIEVADDCPVSAAEIPPVKGGTKTIASLQYELMAEHPYELTSDDVIFEVFAQRQGIREDEWSIARDKFFAKDQPCLRSSPLGKRYGWGIHHDRSGRVAIHALNSDEYQRLRNDLSVTHLKAMRSRRA